MYDTYIYMVHMSTYMVHVCYIYMYTHTYINNNIQRKKGVISLGKQGTGDRKEKGESDVIIV